MITIHAPCPICGKPVKAPFKFASGWVIGCVADRHCVQLFRGASPEEVAEAWDKLFVVEEVPVQ